MLTSKQRARLRAMANTLSDTVLIGKEGLTDAVIAQVEEVLEKHELMKIKILETAMLAPREAQQVLCEELDAEPVQCIGNRFVVYRAREKDPKIILP